MEGWAEYTLAAIVESSDDAIIAMDLNGVILSWDRTAERLFGYTAAEAIGQPITMIFPPDRIEEEAVLLERVTRGETVEHYETDRRRKDGQSVSVSATLSPANATSAPGREAGSGLRTYRPPPMMISVPSKSIVAQSATTRSKSTFVACSSSASVSSFL
jgi:PAS domain S-box-containing protein